MGTKRPRPMCECDVRPVATRASDPDASSHNMCSPCYEYYGAVNQHSDDDHPGVAAGYNATYDRTHGADFLATIRDEMTRCPVCHPELDPRDECRPEQPSYVPGSKTYMSHTDHKHESTPRARARCRASMTADNTPYVDPDFNYSTPIKPHGR